MPNAAFEGLLRRNQKLEALNAEYRALVEVAAAVGSTLNVGSVLDIIVDRCRTLMGAGGAGVFRFDRERGVLVYERGIGLSPVFIERMTLRPGEGTTGRSFLEQAPVWTSDILADRQMRLEERQRRLIEREGYRAVLSVPILIKGRPYGALAVYWWEARVPQSSQVSLLTALAGQAAVALENARLYQAATDRGRRLATLARVHETLTASLSLEDVLDRVAQSVVDLFGSSVSRLWLVDEGGQTMSLRASAGAVTAVEGATRMQVGEGLMGRIVATRAALLVPDLLADGRAVSGDRIRAEGIISFAGIPLTLGDRVLGALSVAVRERRPFDDEDLGLLHSLGSQAATAIHNAMLYAETRRSLEESRALLDVTEILNSTLEPQRLLKRVAIKIAQVCAVDRCTIERWEADRALPLMSQFADGRREPAMWQAFTTELAVPPRDVPVHLRAIETRRPVVIEDAVASELVPAEWPRMFGLRSTMVVPLIRQDEIIGVMSLDYCDRPGRYAPWQVDLAVAIAGQLVLSLENARLYGDAQQRLRETSILLAVGEVLSQPGAPEEVMRRVAREVSRAFGADMVGVYALNAARDALIPLAGYHVPKHLLTHFLANPFRAERMPDVTAAWREGRALWATDVTNDPRFDREVFQHLEPHSVLFAPIAVRGESRGALFLVWWGAGRRPQSAEVSLIEGLAGQLGLAMENMELSQQTAQKLQEMATLLAASRTLSSTLDPEDMARQFLRHVCGSLDAGGAGIWLCDESGQWLEPFMGYHVPKAHLEAFRGLRLRMADHAFYAEAARTRRSVFSPDVSEDPRITGPGRDLVPHHSQLFVPIVAKDRMIGGFTVFWNTRGRDFPESELRLMEAVASQAGVALENARLFRDNNRRVAELSVLHELSRAVTGRLDRSGLVTTIHQQIARVFDVQHLVILLHDEGSDELEVVLRIAESVPDGRLPRRYPRRGTGLMSVILDTGRPLRTCAYAEECRRHGVAPIGEGMGLPHWLGVPMNAGDRTLGVLALRSRDREFTVHDEYLLANIADLAALALRSASLFSERTRAYSELAAAQDQLVRTEKLRALGEMASGVAHDFNNVLAAIVGRAQLLLTETRDPKHRRWLEVIERSGMDGAHTVRRLQEFTRIRRDQPVVAVNLNRMVQESLESTEPRWRDGARTRGVSVEVVTSLTADLPPVAGDPSELREALINLILNAVDAMPDGGTLAFATVFDTERVELTVADTGSGMPEHVRQRIFDPFFTTKGPQGTGLGLSMTYGILSRHGAQISVESEEGKGTRFRLTFPRTTLAESAASPAAAPPAAALLRCLVVDDEQAVGEVLGDIIESAGHRAVVVEGGAAALARFRSEPFDAVFTDLAMPGMSGWELARTVSDLNPEVPVFVVTGFGVEVPPAELADHGVRAVLTKPLGLHETQALLATLRPPR
ncbi:MAG TPA: GAF domain-containing protein [Methylomirabilota bacterium]|nr:GAF domain-containing protein [Methylomirabilota bacterium]